MYIRDEILKTPTRHIKKMTDEKEYSALIDQVKHWMDEASKTEPNDPNAACLATCSKDGKPSARMVLVKTIDSQNHFVIYTNHQSRKGRELLGNSYAALTIYWKTTGKQIRIEGSVEVVSDDEADEYYNSRSRGSRIGAWASQQSQPLENRDTLIQRYKDIEDKYKDKDIPRPPYWSGFRIIPIHIEFWEDGEYRLHKREVYTPIKDKAGFWAKTYLNP